MSLPEALAYSFGGARRKIMCVIFFEKDMRSFRASGETLRPANDFGARLLLIQFGIPRAATRL